MASFATGSLVRVRFDFAAVEQGEVTASAGEVAVVKGAPLPRIQRDARISQTPTLDV